MDEDTKKSRRNAARMRYRAMHDPVGCPCCQACGFAYPPVMHLHHVYPLAETDKAVDDFAWLCPNCHAMVHEIRRVLHSKRKPTNLRVRLDYLDYWLTTECPSHVADKLRDLAARTL